MRGENAGYPTLCKGRFITDIEGERKCYHALEEPTSLNTLSLLPELFAANVASVKLRGVNEALRMSNKSPALGVPRLIAT